ncbi:hypothetical protein QAD02_023186 [Eretmocerus hayati]|uniref:Uncharacterized protein n=1 Tax=Eretmocerus hayati TaxID=131215 RepID=A0ACC2PVG6_9HYME|nr:hypothetical protein QAD02_023186 [Eretmocerus hayati]
MIEEEMSPYMELETLSKMKDHQEEWTMNFSNFTKLFKQHLLSASQDVLRCYRSRISDRSVLKSNDYLLGCDYDLDKIKERMKSFDARDGFSGKPLESINPAYFVKNHMKNTEVDYTIYYTQFLQFYRRGILKYRDALLSGSFKRI